MKMNKYVKWLLLSGIFCLICWIGFGTLGNIWFIPGWIRDISKAIAGECKTNAPWFMYAAGVAAIVTSLVNLIKVRRGK